MHPYSLNWHDIFRLVFTTFKDSTNFASSPSPHFFRTGGSGLDSTEIYRAATGLFEFGPPLPEAMSEHTVVKLDAVRFIFCGNTASGSVIFFNPVHTG